MKDPYGWSVEAMFGPSRGLLRQYRRLVRQVAPYLATPIRALAREIRRAGCNTILCQEYESPRFDAAVAVGRLLRIPVFATFQGGSWHRSRIEGWLRPITLRRCSGLIIGSSIEEDRLREKYGMSDREDCAHLQSARCRGVAGRFARGRANQAWNFGFDAGRRLAWPYRHPPEGARCPAQSVEGCLFAAARRRRSY